VRGPMASSGIRRSLPTSGKNLHDVTDASIALAAFDDFFASAFDTNTTKAAKDYIDRLDIDRRDRVRDYFVPLWFWTRLDADRWNLASRQLRAEHSRAKQTLHVDHVVPLFRGGKKHPTGDEEEGRRELAWQLHATPCELSIWRKSATAGRAVPKGERDGDSKNDASIPRSMVEGTFSYLPNSSMRRAAGETICAHRGGGKDTENPQGVEGVH